MLETLLMKLFHSQGLAEKPSIVSGLWTSGWVLRHRRAPCVNYPELVIGQEEFNPRFVRATELQMGSCPGRSKDMNLMCQRHLHRGQLNGGDFRGTVARMGRSVIPTGIKSICGGEFPEGGGWAHSLLTNSTNMGT